MKRERAPGGPCSVAQAAALLNLSTKTVYRLIAARELPSYRDGARGGKILIPERAVLRRLESKATAAEARCAEWAPRVDHFAGRVRRRRISAAGPD